MFNRVLSLLMLVAVSGCKDRSLNALATDLSVPESVDFGTVYVGYSSTQSVELINRGRAAVEFEVSVTQPFTTLEHVRVPGGSTVQLEIALAPESAGAIEDNLHLTADQLVFEVHLLASPSLAPSCTPSADCVESHFDPASGCVETPLTDGASCGAEDLCITNGTCQQGVCRGQMVSCDDGNACTADACNPKQGCIHPPVQCAQPLNACEVAVCRPDTGCGTEPAVDGARCGENDCQMAHVCISGSCELRPAPEGSECGEPSTCLSAGHCAGNVCQPGTPQVPAPRWSYTPSTDMNVMRVVVDRAGNTYALVGTNIVYPEDGGTSPPYPLWLYSFDRDGHPRFGVNLSSETPGLENGIGLMIDPDAEVLYLAARTYNYGTATPHKVIVAQARDSRNGARIWESDLHQDIPILNSSDGEMHLDLTRFMLLTPNVLAISLVEGESLHQAYVKALSTATGLKVWQTQRPGHMSSGASGNGEVWEGSAACWSSEYRVSRITPSGATLNQKLFSTSMLAFSQDRSLIRTANQLAWLEPNFNVTPINLRPSQQLPYGSYPRIDGSILTLVTTDALTRASLDRYDVDAGTWLWSTQLGAGTVEQTWSLTNGATAAYLSSGDGGTELVTVSGSGQVTERCPYGAATGIAVTRGLYLTRDGASITAFDVPGREPATSGWTGPDGFMGTGRYR